MGRFSRHNLESVWTGVGTYLVIFAIAYLSGGFFEAWETIQLFFSGKPDSLLRPGTYLSQAIPLASAILVIDLPISIAVAYTVHSLPKVHAGSLTRSLGGIRKWIARIQNAAETSDEKGKQIFASFFAIIFLEEVFARLLFLGILYKAVEFIPYASAHTIGFYLLFLIGNGLWALAHLGNYERRFGRSVLWVAPQFFGGILFTIIYWRYGFWATLITHFAYDTMIWCIDRKQQVDPFDLLRAAACAAYAVVFYLMLQHSPLEILHWINGDVAVDITHWSFWEFSKLSLCYEGFAGALFGLLLYDQSGCEKQSSSEAILKGGLAAILSCYFVIWALQGITGNAPVSILIFALLRIFNATDTSLSAMCRTFWSSVPLASITVCAIQILPFWSAFCFLVLTIILLIPLILLEHRARER